MNWPMFWTIYAAIAAAGFTLWVILITEQWWRTRQFRRSEPHPKGNSIRED